MGKGHLCHQPPSTYSHNFWSMRFDESMVQSSSTLQFNSSMNNTRNKTETEHTAVPTFCWRCLTTHMLYPRNLTSCPSDSVVSSRKPVQHCFKEVILDKILDASQIELILACTKPQITAMPMLDGRIRDSRKKCITNVDSVLRRIKSFNSIPHPIVLAAQEIKLR